MILGKFNKKLKEASCHLMKTEFNPWFKVAERAIKELKKGFNRKLIKSGALKRLWDDCLQLEFYVRSNTAQGIYKLDGEFLEILMTGKMSDISQLCEFEWLEWVML